MPAGTRLPRAAPGPLRIGVYADNTLALPLEQLCAVLNSCCRVTRFEPGHAPFHINSAQLSLGEVRTHLSPQLLEETEEFDLTFLATNVPYDTNYFFERAGSRILVSFSGWNRLTGLPLTNGLTYFMADVMLERLGPVPSHEETTGCVSDFLWDKRGVDVGMKAAFICGECRQSLPGDAETQAQLADVEGLLELLCSASRAHSDIVSSQPGSNEAYDAFLCHNSADKPMVRTIDKALRDAEVRTWLDENELDPGLPWLVELEQQIERVRRSLVFVGPDGFGPWQNVEIRALLAEFVNRRCPVIPVLLPGAPAAPTLPPFLRQMTWIDLRSGYDEGMAFLIEVLKRR